MFTCVITVEAFIALRALRYVEQTLSIVVGALGAGRWCSRTLRTVRPRRADDVHSVIAGQLTVVA